MGDTIKALTICQPWAWAVLHGPRDGVAWKRFENRCWATEYVGPLVIHAGKSESWMGPGLEFLRAQGVAPLRSELAFGAILGVVDMVDCVRPSEAKRPDGSRDPYAFDNSAWCHEYANPRRLATPVPWKGRLQFFDVPREIVAELLEQEAGGGRQEAGPAETKEQRIDRAIAAAGGSGRLKRAAQGSLWK
ncbi:MAG: hypothetical protein JNK76_20510 [Planctomycetales bacterium]|nr:hypothetical protein [Planctomycetales bacterium]